MDEKHFHLKYYQSQVQTFTGAGYELQELYYWKESGIVSVAAKETRQL